MHRSKGKSQGKFKNAIKEMKITIYQNLQDITKAVLRRKFMALDTH